MNVSKRTLYIGGVLTLVGLLLAFFMIFGLGPKGSTSGEIVVRPEEYDLGNVPYGGGIVQREFTLENRGEEGLKINSIETSCGCTEAQLIYDGNTSKKFGMNTNTLTWSETVPPEEKASLRIFYDPTTHGPDGVGPFLRKIWIKSSDPDDNKTEVRIKGSVTR